MNEKAEADLPREAIQFLDHLAVERGASKNTLISYRRDLLDFFREHRSLSQDAMTDYVSSLRRSGMAETSVARKVSTLRSYQEFLTISQGNTSTWHVDLKNRGRRLPKAPSLETVNRLLESCDESITGLRDRAILESLYATGMRVSECTSLNLNQFITDESGIRMLHVTGKGGKGRLVPLGQHAGKACEDYLVRSRPALLRDVREPGLFLNARGARLTRQAIWQIIKLGCKRAGIKEEITPHSLRHAFATHMLERGADVRSVQELLGHASVVTTQIYTMVTNDVLRETHATAHPRAH